MKRITTKELSDGLLQAKKNAEDLLKVYDGVLGAIRQSADILKNKVLKIDLGNAKDIESLANALRESNKLIEARIKLDKQIIENKTNLKRINAEEQAITRENIKTLKEEEKLAQEKIKTTKAQNALTEQETRIKEKANNSTKKELDFFQKLTKARNQAQIELKNGIVQYGETSKKVEALQRKFDNLDQAYAKINKRARDGRADVGRYTLATENLGKSFLGLSKNLIGGLGLIGGVSLLAQGLKEAFTTIKDFEFGIDKLQAIIGASEKDMVSLKDTILDLGRSTKFTATEVSEAATELAKLGFTASDIEKSLGGILKGSVAMGASVPDTAELVSKTIKAMGLDVSQTESVVATLAASTNKSATSFRYLADSMPYAMTGARLAGVSVERLSAYLGILADNALPASTAGVALRDIFKDLSVKGLTLDDALEKISKSSNKNKTAFELFGATSKDTAVILSDNRHKFDELTEAVSNQEQALQELADTLSDNLQGDINKAKSSWEGFILSLDSGGGVITKISRAFIQGFTDITDALIRLNETQETFNKRVTKEAESRYYKSVSKQISDMEQKMIGAKKTEEEIYKRKLQYISNQTNSQKAFYLKSQKDLADNIKKEAELRKQQQNTDDNESIFDIGSAKGKEQVKARGENLKAINNLIADRKRLNELILENKGELDAYNKILTETIKKESDKSKITKDDDESNGNNNTTKDKTKAERELTGAIEKQEKLISDLQTAKKRANESEISGYTERIDLAQIELDRLIELGKKKAEIKGETDLERAEREAKEREEAFNAEIEDEEDLAKFSELQAKKTIQSKDELDKFLYENEKARLENTIAIYEKYGYSTLDLEIQLTDLINAEKDKRAEKDEKIREKNTEKDKEAIKQIREKSIEASEAILNAWKKNSEKRQDELNKEIDQAKNRNDELLALTNSSNSQVSQIAADSLEKQRQIEREKREELQKELKKQQTIEVILAGLNSYKANAGQPNAAGRTLADIGVLITGLKALGSFKSGTDRLGEVDSPLDKDGGRPIIAHNGEMILQKKLVDEMGRPSRFEVADVFTKFKDGDLIDKKSNKSSINQILVNTDNSELVKEMQGIRTEINNSNQVSIALDLTKKMIKLQQRKGNRINEYLIKK